MRGYGHEGVVEKIRAKGGGIYAITSEPQRLAAMAQDEWSLDFESVGDPHHEISGACQDRGWLKVIINNQTGHLVNPENSIYAHPKGFFQPGVLSLDSTGSVLYRWRGVPTRRNMGGATERPTPSHVFDKVTQALDVPGVSVDAELDTEPKLDSRGLPWPIFLSLLVANGWFIKPKTFPFSRNGPPVRQRVKRAFVRIPFFIAAWIIAFIALPGLWVGAALLGWAIWLTPHIRVINSQFQNEPLA